jgi:protein-L-isoaspartate(D-aspartate) O-methyltransferase
MVRAVAGIWTCDTDLSCLPGRRRTGQVPSRTVFARVEVVRQHWSSMSEAATVLRKQMVDRLREAGVLITPAVEQAMATVPRHLFVPQVEIDGAYVEDAVMVKHAKDGRPISSVSQPQIVATMLEQLEVWQGHHVLEIGTGTGYNAALLGVLCGSDGAVVSVELEPDLAKSAGQILAQLDFDQIKVVVGDGRDGWTPRAPYDRLIVTTGASEVATAWLSQLLEGGRMVVPIVDQNGVGSILVFEKVGGELRRCAETPCGFLPMRDAPV